MSLYLQLNMSILGMAELNNNAMFVQLAMCVSLYSCLIICFCACLNVFANFLLLWLYFFSFFVGLVDFTFTLFDNVDFIIFLNSFSLRTPSVYLFVCLFAFFDLLFFPMFVLLIHSYIYRKSFLTLNGSGQMTTKRVNVPRKS